MTRTSLICALIAASCGVAAAQERPKLGVRVHPSSILVAKVEDGSTAATGGLAAGDVIVRCGRTDVETIDDVVTWLRGLEPGSETTIGIRRGNDEKTLTLAFGEGRARLGIEATGGLSVLAVTEGSVAASAGLKAGDVIIGFGNDEIESFEALRGAIGRVEPGEDVSVRVRRGDRVETLWASFAAPKEKEEPSPPDHPARRPHGVPGMPPGMPPFPGMEAFGSLMQIGELNQDLAVAIELLLEMNDPKLADVVKKLQSVHGRLSKVADAMKNVHQMVERFKGGVESLDEAFGDMEMPDMGEIQERLQELMSDGLTLEKIQKIIAKEFPGVEIQLGGGEADDEDPPPPAGSKKDDGEK